MRQLRPAVVIAVLALGMQAPATSWAGFTQVVAFGDSLIDTGNVFAATGNPPAPYFDGRYSNGPVWVEYLAGRLGIAAPTPSLTGGTDYAWGGADTGTGLSTAGTLNVNSQVADFLSAHTLGANQLVVIDGGANDFLNAGKTDPSVPVANLAAAITALADAGGRTFIVQNLPQLGEIPATAGLSQAQRDALDQLSLAYDSLLGRTLDQLHSSLGVTIGQVDLNGFLTDVRANPSSYGFTNTTTSALGDGVLTGDGYLFWDAVHPTTAADKFIGDLAFASVVPEPGGMVLFAIGTAVLLTAHYRHHVGPTFAKYMGLK
jgi:phospholipase/lecithinase/hemolysin